MDATCKRERQRERRQVKLSASQLFSQKDDYFYPPPSWIWRWERKTGIQQIKEDYDEKDIIIIFKKRWMNSKQDWYVYK